MQRSRALSVKMLRVLRLLPIYSIAALCVLALRLIRPLLLVRIGALIGSRIGHFAANTEVYLCERDARINIPLQNYVDLFYIPDGSICNQQLAKMWKRTLHILPSFILFPIDRLNRLLPGWKAHVIGVDSRSDRDVNNLYNNYPPHLTFTDAEEAKGKEYLRDMCVREELPFICLNVRDSSYLDNHLPGDWSYHNYRDSNIENYVLAAEEMARRGYYVIRMGARVHKAMQSNHPRVIDYASNGMRSDFMDIYLAARCSFCITTGTGWDSVADAFRRPLVFVNFMPLGVLVSFRRDAILITKHHWAKSGNRELTLSEIFSRGIGYCFTSSEYDAKDVLLIENTPEEIRDVTVEMSERLCGTWQDREGDEGLQKRFWEIFPTGAIDAYHGTPLHGEIRCRFGSVFLRNNRQWLQ